MKHKIKWKSSHRRRKHCVLAVVRQSQKFSPHRRPPSRGRGTAKIQSAGNLYLQTQFGEDRCTQFRVIVVTDPQTHTPTDRTGYNTLRCSFTSVQCNHTSTDTTITFHCCYCAFTLDCAFIYARYLWTHITDSRTSVNWQTCSYYVPATIGRRRKAMLLSDVCLTSVCLTSSVCHVHRA